MTATSLPWCRTCSARVPTSSRSPKPPTSAGKRSIASRMIRPPPRPHWQRGKRKADFCFRCSGPPNLAGLCAARSPASRVLRRNLRALLCAPLGSSSGCCGHDRDNTQHRPRCRGRCAGRLRLQRARCRRSGSARAHCARARIIFARVRLCLPTTAIEGGILRAGGLVGGRFAHTIKRIMDESPTYASGSVHANASMH